jgi:hypothetical protein
MYGALTAFLERHGNGYGLPQNSERTPEHWAAYLSGRWMLMSRADFEAELLPLFREIQSMGDALSRQRQIEEPQGSDTAEWHPIETAVQSYRPIQLGWDNGEPSQTGSYSAWYDKAGDYREGWIVNGDPCDPKPTHWRELPAPPRSSEEPALAGDTGSPQAQQQPDTKNLPHPIVPETGH